MIYIDMDGVLAVWDTETTPEETKKNRYFLYREKENCIIELINALKARGYDVCILSAVWNEGAANDKSEWLDQVLGNIKRVFVPYGEDKSRYIKGTNNVLIDDYTENLQKWHASGNIPIKFYNGINGNKGRYKGASISRTMSISEMLNVVEAVA